MYVLEALDSADFRKMPLVDINLEIKAPEVNMFMPTELYQKIRAAAEKRRDVSLNLIVNSAMAKGWRNADWSRSVRSSQDIIIVVLMGEEAMIKNEKQFRIEKAQARQERPSNFRPGLWQAYGNCKSKIHAYERLGEGECKTRPLKPWRTCPNPRRPSCPFDCVD